jgi:hypothetical protein
MTSTRLTPRSDCLSTRDIDGLSTKEPPRGCQSQAGIGWNLRAEVEPSDAPIEKRFIGEVLIAVSGTKSSKTLAGCGHNGLQISVGSGK